MALQSADTSTGMLGRVQAGDTHAWSEFSERCRMVVTDWCRWHNLQSADTDDIVQETLLVVMNKIRDFDRAGRGSLRAWLRGIAWRCWCRAVAKADRANPELLRSLLQSSYNDIAQLEAEYDRLAQLEALQKAMAVVQKRVTSNTWQAFFLTALHDHSGSEAGELLGMTADAVHSSRARVQRLITAELRRQQSADFRS
ncbi:MAG: RNA polymerase sigma factor [Planctomycetota bacterium]